MPCAGRRRHNTAGAMLCVRGRPRGGHYRRRGFFSLHRPSEGYRRITVSCVAVGLGVIIILTIIEIENGLIRGTRAGARSRAPEYLLCGGHKIFTISRVKTIIIITGYYYDCITIVRVCV